MAGVAPPRRQTGQLLRKLWATALLLPRSVSAFIPRFSNAFQSHMVLQRGRPLVLWGFGAGKGAGLTVEFSPSEEAQRQPVMQGQTISDSDGRWEVTLPTPLEKFVGLSMKLTVTKNGTSDPSQELQDVTLGDVYLFTGQSNVDLPESYALQRHPHMQRQEETFAEEMGKKGLIRIMIVPNQVPGLHYGREPALELTNSPDCRLCPPPFGPKWDMPYKVCHCNSLRWTRATAAAMRGYSALGWFSGAALARTMPFLKGVPLGLVRSSWGGTKILRWSSPDAMSRCPQSVKPQRMASDLFSNMIYPMAKLQFSAIVWMHGASDTGRMAAYQGPSYYACALTAMIMDWREKFRREHLPFIVVELPAYCNERDWATFHTFCDQKKSILRDTEYHLPAMRVAQAEAEKLKHVYMVTAMDLGSLHPMGGSIHSDRKQELGVRVALAARAAVYNDSNVIWEAPTAVSASVSHPQHVSVKFSTRSNEFLVLNNSARCPPQILPIYCTGGGFELYSNGSWFPAVSAWLGQDTSVVLRTSLNGTIERVRYAYADWPVCNLRSAVTGLPARIFDLPVAAAREIQAATDPDAYLKDMKGIEKQVEREVKPLVGSVVKVAKARGEEGLEKVESYILPRWQIVSLVSLAFLSTLCVVRHAVAPDDKEAVPRTPSRARVLETGRNEEVHLNTKALLAPLSPSSETASRMTESESHCPMLERERSEDAHLNPRVPAKNSRYSKEFES